MALFDVVINNADRKAGHLIVDTEGKVWGVDHGVTFSDEPKLRTVIWAFEGEEIDAKLLDDLRSFDSYDLPGLDASEVSALRQRVEELIATRRYPSPDPYRHHVPWPPF